VEVRTLALVGQAERPATFAAQVRRLAPSQKNERAGSAPTELVQPLSAPSGHALYVRFIMSMSVVVLRRRSRHVAIEPSLL